MAGDGDDFEWLDEPLRSEMKALVQRMVSDTLDAFDDIHATEPQRDRMAILRWLVGLARSDRDTYRLIREALWTLRVENEQERSLRSVCPSNMS